jgi:glycosyltransferase involved in cell wall biosynthesis
MADARIKILYLIDYFHRTGGTEKHLAQLIKGLPVEEFRCSLVAFDLGTNRLLDDLRDAGVPVIHLPVGREYVPSAAVQAWRLASLIRRNRYDIVQTFHQKSDSYGALVAWLAGARHLISSKRDTGELRKPWHVFLNRRLTRLFDAVIAVAEEVRNAVITRDRLPLNKVTTIYNGVDTLRFMPPTAAQREQARSSFGFAREDFVVGMVAGFRPEKNHDIFFAGLEKALPFIPSLKVVVVGAGPLLETFRERVSSLGDRVVFTGELPDVLPALWAMDVGCLTPGRNEGFSNAIIEQMSAGLPMIVTNVGGNAEAVVEGVTGRVIPPGSVEALSTALVELNADRTRAVAMGSASRARAEERFSLKRMCADHAELYLRLVAASPTERPRE